MRLWLLAGMLAACHSPSFPELVTAANKRWEVAICRTPRYTDIQYVDSITTCATPGSYLGCYTLGSAVIQVSKKTKPEHLLWVITHEMGHSLAASAAHVPPNKGIMSPGRAHSTPNITAADIELLCEDYECPCRNPEAP